MTDHVRILIVDDEPSALETIEALLAPCGYQLEFATSGQEVLALLSGPCVDLVLCDVRMLGMDGYDVCRALKADPRWRLVPIILITALDGQDDLVRGLEAGGDEFLTKPVDKAVLRARVRSMLRIREHYNQLQNRAADVESLLRARRERIVTESRLSEREREVLELLLLGRSHDEIAAVLGISARTSKFHQENLLQKLGADSRFDLLRIFV